LDVLISPEYRGYRLGRRFIEARKELCRQHNLRAILAGGEFPNITSMHTNLFTRQIILGIGLPLKKRSTTLLYHSNFRTISNHFDC